jgi:4-amino-4-deoxy-L-arabinose transferase-like glycosyltransferase
LGFCLVAFFVQVNLSSREKSAAFDEQYHLSAGYAYLKTGDYRLSRTVGHPPLANLLNALPLSLEPDIHLPLEHPSWGNGDFQWFSETFLWRVNGDPQGLLELGRLSTALLGSLTALLLFIWARQLANPLAGWLALLLAILDPNLIANSRLITTDLALAFFALFAIWRLWSWLVWPTRSNLLVVGFAAGMVMATKYTGLLIWPIFLLILLLFPGFSLKRLGGLILMGFLAYVVLWVVYRFEIGPVAGAPLPIPILAPAYPEAVWRTFSYISEQPVPAFLFGRISEDGWWYYFPATLAVKTPLPLLLLSLAGLVTALIRHGWRRSSVLWLPPLAFLLLAMAGNFNIGYRHILQVVPFLIMLAAQTTLIPEVMGERSLSLAALNSFLQPQDGRTVRPRAAVPAVLAIVLLLLLAWQAVSMWRLYPHHEAYFNELAGGPEKGSEILVDSNLDWGQDLPALRRSMAEMGIDEVYLSYFGTAPPEAYGVRYKPLPGFIRFTAGPEIDAYNPYNPAPGWYAIAATSLRLGLIRQNPDLYAYFGDLEPAATAGHSIFLYEVSYPENVATNRKAVVGQAVSDLSPDDLEIDSGERVIVKWVESPETAILPAGSEWTTGRTQPISADFSGINTLLGFELEESTIRPGESVALTLYWRTGSEEVETPAPTLGEPLAAFVHLTAEDSGQIVAQYDGWGAAQSGLESGDIVVQRLEIPVPDDTAGGRYHLQAGLYSPQSSHRLTAIKDGEIVDSVRLAAIMVN